MPDSELKHPRNPNKKPRKNILKATRLDIKKPSAKEIKKWKPLEDLCISQILQNERSDNIARKRMIRLSSPTPPLEGMHGRRIKTLEDGCIVFEYNAEGVLCWLYERWLSDWTPNMLYRSRQGYMLATERLINDAMDIEDYVEFFAEHEYNVEIEEGKIDVCD